MGLEQRSYSILIVSASENFNTSLFSLLAELGGCRPHTVENINSAKRALAERMYDFVIINSPLPDESGIRFAIDACSFRGTVVLLMVRNDLHDEIYSKVFEHGVFTLPKPTSRQTMMTALSWMASAKERLKKSEKKTLSIEEKMEEIRLVNRAKWILISELKMTEPEAHRYIEKKAMDCCVSKRDVAQDIIRTYC